MVPSFFVSILIIPSLFASNLIVPFFAACLMVSKSQMNSAVLFLTVLFCFIRGKDQSIQLSEIIKIQTETYRVFWKTEAALCGPLDFQTLYRSTSSCNDTVLRADLINR
jgi:hypothetical protein